MLVTKPQPFSEPSLDGSDSAYSGPLVNSDIAPVGRLELPRVPLKLPRTAGLGLRIARPARPMLPSPLLALDCRGIEGKPDDKELDSLISLSVVSIRSSPQPGLDDRKVRAAAAINKDW